MNRFIYIFAIILAFSQLSFSQQFANSNLPIIIINTDGGVDIPDDPRVRATMKIIYRGEGQRNNLTDKDNPDYLNYNGRIDIEVRGSSSQSLPKKPYGFTTRLSDNITVNNVSLLGLPAENDWILNCLNFEPSCIRDFLSYNLARQMGNYATRTVYCEVVINNDYKGLYVLQEKIKADKNRVDITRITPLDNSLPALSGGYITKADKPNGDPVAWTMFTWYQWYVDYIHEFPKPEDITVPQSNYIQTQFQKLAAAAYNQDESLINGYPAIIDIPSFIDFILINELASNPDAYQFSTYFHKDRNGKLRAGPIWDINLSYGNDLFIWGYDRSKTNIWQIENGENDGSRFWRDLFHDAKFRCYLSKRWNELIQPGQPFDPDRLDSFIDKTVLNISEALVREEARWGTIGNHALEITGIKTFLRTRIDWITANIGSYSNCTNVAVPPIVISKIMYNPSVSDDFPVSTDLEFIEITNNGNRTADLTGVYFSGTGLVYQFPANTTIGPYTSKILASNAAIFQAKYGYVPFGQYTRHLSNKGQEIELTDAFGNVIDNVTYADSLPWPDADGNGYFLSLFNISSDNSLPESWEATMGSIIVDITELKVKISPNPVISDLSVLANSDILKLTLYNSIGNIVYMEQVNCESFNIDMSGFASGIYLLKVQTAIGNATVKIAKVN
jgi:hypothetical protein